MSESYCERCRNTGWAFVVRNWRGMERQATKPCTCASGRAISVDMKGVFQTQTEYVHESGYAEVLCPDCGGIHVRSEGGCPTPRTPKNPITVKSRHPEPVIEYVSSGADRAANDSGKG